MLMKRFIALLQPIMSALVGVLVTSLIVSAPVQANHLGNSNIQSMHSAATNELVCINYVSGNNSNFDQTVARVKGSLYLDTPPTGEANWDEIAWDSVVSNYKIWFAVWSTSCNSLSTSDRNNTPIEISVQENTTANCGGTGLEGDGVNCAWKDGAVVTHTINGVDHYDYAKGFNLYNDIYIGNSTESTWRHVISHEMGHVLGLLDGDGTCPVSIMHSQFYGCTTSYAWPKSLDISSVYDRATSAK